MVDKGDIKNPKASLAASGIKILTSMLKREDFWFVVFGTKGFDDVFAWMFVSMFEFAMMFLDVFAVVLRVSNLVESAPYDCLGFGLFCNDDAFEPMFTCTDPTVLTDEVRCTGSLHEQLGHDSVVVIVDR
jgi:hypothetical protein